MRTRLEIITPLPTDDAQDIQARACPGNPGGNCTAPYCNDGNKRCFIEDQGKAGNWVVAPEAVNTHCCTGSVACSGAISMQQ
jgi:hypothetical protein